MFSRVMKWMYRLLVVTAVCTGVAPCAMAADVTFQHVPTSWRNELGEWLGGGTSVTINDGKVVFLNEKQAGISVYLFNKNAEQLAEVLVPPSSDHMIGKAVDVLKNPLYEGQKLLSLDNFTTGVFLPLAADITPGLKVSDLPEGGYFEYVRGTPKANVLTAIGIAISAVDAGNAIAEVAFPEADTEVLKRIKEALFKKAIQDPGLINQTAAILMGNNDVKTKLADVCAAYAEFVKKNSYLFATEFALYLANPYPPDSLVNGIDLAMSRVNAIVAAEKAGGVVSATSNLVRDLTKGPTIFKLDLIIGKTGYDGTIPAQPEASVAAPTVTASPEGGTFRWFQRVTLVTDDPEATIYYTIDGTEPGETNSSNLNAVYDISSLRYDEPFTLFKTTTVRYRAVAADGRLSAVGSVTYEQIEHATDPAYLEIQVPDSRKADYSGDDKTFYAEPGQTIRLTVKNGPSPSPYAALAGKTVRVVLYLPDGSVGLVPGKLVGETVEFMIGATATGSSMPAGRYNIFTVMGIGDDGSKHPIPPYSNQEVISPGSAPDVAPVGGAFELQRISLPGVKSIAMTDDGTGWLTYVNIEGLDAYAQLQGGGLSFAGSVYDYRYGLGVSSVMANGLLYSVTGDWDACHLNIFSVSNPSAPELIGTTSDLGTDWWHGGCASSVAVSGNYAFAAGRNNGISVSDISNQSSPPLVMPPFPFSSGTNDVEISGSLLLAASGWFDWSALDVLDISNPLKPVRIGMSRFNEASTKLQLNGKRAWQLTYNAGYRALHVIDFSNPSVPFNLGRFDPGFSIKDFVVRDNIVYAVGEGFIALFDAAAIEASLYAGVPKIELIGETLPAGSFLSGYGQKKWTFRNLGGPIVGLEMEGVITPDGQAKWDDGINFGAQNIPTRIEAGAEFTLDGNVWADHEGKPVKSAFYTFFTQGRQEVLIANVPERELQLRVRTNRNPEFSPLQLDSVAARVGQPVSLPVIAVDPDRDRLTCTVVSGGGETMLSNVNYYTDNGHVFTYTGTFGSAGVHPVTVEIDDAHQGKARYTFYVVVTGDGSVANFFSDVPYPADPAAARQQYDQYLAIHFLALKGAAIGHPDPADPNRRVFKGANVGNRAEALGLIMRAAALRGLLALDAPSRPLPNLVRQDPVEGVFYNFSWAAPYALKAEQLGIIKRAELFDPTGPATREWVARVVARIMTLDTSIAAAENETGNVFTDAADFSSADLYGTARAAAYFGYMGKLGSAESFHPKDAMIRADLAVVAARILSAPTMTDITTAGLDSYNTIGRDLPTVFYKTSFTVTGTTGLAGHSVSDSHGVISEKLPADSADYIKVTIFRPGIGIIAEKTARELADSPVLVSMVDEPIVKTEVRTLIIVLTDSITGVRSSYHYDYLVVFRDWDGDGVADDVDPWPYNRLYSVDANGNGIPDYADTKWNLAARKWDAPVMFGGSQWYLIDLILSGQFSPDLFDTTPPELAISSLPDNAVTGNGVLNITGKVTDVSPVALKVNGTDAPVNGDGSFSAAVLLKDGQNTVTVVAHDALGNETTWTRTIYLDRLAPIVTIDSLADNSVTPLSFVMVSGTFTGAETVTVARDYDAPVFAELNGNRYSAVVYLHPSINTITVTATDVAGNNSNAKRTVLFDNEKPFVAVTDPAQDIATTQEQVVLRGIVGDNFANVTVRITVGSDTFTPPVVNGQFEQLISLPEEKTYLVTVTGIDGAGNEVSMQRNVVRDNTAPVNTQLMAATDVRRIRLWWAEVPSAVSYRLAYQEGQLPPASCDEGVLLYEGDQRGFTHEPLLPELTISYRLCAIDAVGNISSGATTTSSATDAIFGIITNGGSGGKISPEKLTVPNNGTATFVVTPNDGYQIATVTGCGGSLSGTTYTTGKITGNCGVFVTFSSAPLNSSCGDAAGASFLSAPANGLCSAGTPSPVAGSGPWYWKCTGANGGKTASCSATRKILTVTPATTGNGIISPSAPVKVAPYSIKTFILTPAYGYHIGTVNGCGGSLSGATYSTAAAEADCTVTATFAADPITYTWTTGTSAVSLGHRAGKATVSFTVATTGPVTSATVAVKNDVSWISVIGDAAVVPVKKGKGGGRVTITAAANPSSESRTATIELNGRPVTITQAGAPCVIRSAAVTSGPPSAAGGDIVISVAAPEACRWTAVLPVVSPWLTSTVLSGTASGTLTVNAAANHGGIGTKGIYVKAKTRKVVLLLQTVAEKPATRKVSVTQPGD